MPKLIAPVAAALLCLSACGSAGEQPTGSGRPSPSGPSPVAASSGAEASATRSAFPTGAPVTSGPIGGNWCASGSAWWSPSGTGIVVQVQAPGPALLSVSIEDSANNPIGSGTGRMDEGAQGVEVHVPNVDVRKVAAVSVAIAGANIVGSCAVPKG